MEQAVIAGADFQALLDTLQNEGFQVLGPTVRDGTIVYDEVTAVSDLPVGWTDEQSAGVYRLKPRPDRALFGYVVGPHSWKKYLHPPRVKLWSARRAGRNFQVGAEPQEPPRRALLGVRPCELHAIALQDRVFLTEPYIDPSYAARRAQLFVIAVNCTQPGGSCFCTSLDTGPQARTGFDWALTEVCAEERHFFLVTCGSDAGRALLRKLPHRPAEKGEIAQAERLVQQAAEEMEPRLETEGLKEFLYENSKHPYWYEVGRRCLACANCTMVCPTCFCTTIEDYTDLQGDHAERWRVWDSCFTLDFAYLHGGSARPSAFARYRHWITHKLASWHDQFGATGCVGCGRCITWCPVGIDITEEIRRLREAARARKQEEHEDA